MPAISRLRVYPRVCGGTMMPCGDAGLLRGLSPRVRGNLNRGTAQNPYRRSIPACAGEPVLLFWPTCVRWVYPRVCGGTSPSDPMVHSL